MLRAIRPGSPPMDAAQRSASIWSSTHSIDGVLIVLPANRSSIRPALLVMRNSFGTGHAGTWRSSRSTARGLSTIMPCAASPPSTFCHDQVVTSSFGQGNSIAKAADVASQIDRPLRSSAIQSPSGTRTPPLVPFHVNTTSCAQLTAFRSGRLPNGATNVRAPASFNTLSTSVTQLWPKVSHARQSTSRSPSSDHNAISTAPVSEPGTMAIR